MSTATRWRQYSPHKNNYMIDKTILIALGIAIAAVALLMLVLGLKMLLGKEKEYKRPCANADPKTGRCAHCTCDKRLKKVKKG